MRTRAMTLSGLASVLAACSFTPGQLAGEDAAVVTNDADRVFMDARVDTPPGQECFGSELLVVCYEAGQVPSGEYRPTQSPISTSNMANCDRLIAQANGPELCLKSAGTIVIDRTIRFSGNRPIVLLATDSLTITEDGRLDVSRGAGADTGQCSPAGAGGADTSPSNNAGAGGGGGGGFGTPGGPGGAGNSAGGGGAGGAQAVSYIRGGCRGARGGNSYLGAGSGGRGGASGGGVYLIAKNTITIDGIILANGGGGKGGANKAGGGGGGSGGFIGLDAATVTMDEDGALGANGGGGGEGGGGGDTGQDGEDAQGWNQIPDGGAGNGQGGNGGNGARGAAEGGPGGESGDSGGGGGGGVGRIRIFASSQSLSQNISPPAQ